MAAWLSSTGISHHDLLPHIPSIHLSTVNSSPQTGIAAQSLNSSSCLCPFQETHIPAQHMYGCGKDCLILIPFRLPQISCFTLSLKCFSSDSDNCPAVRIRPLLQSVEGRCSPTNTPVFPPSSFILPSFVWWFYIFFPTGQVLLSTLSWCSARIALSEGVFLMYPWREMYSTSTSSSAVFFSPLLF